MPFCDHISILVLPQMYYVLVEMKRTVLVQGQNGYSCCDILPTYQRFFLASHFDIHEVPGSQYNTMLPLLLRKASERHFAGKLLQFYTGPLFAFLVLPPALNIFHSYVLRFLGPCDKIMSHVAIFFVPLTPSRNTNRIGSVFALSIFIR